MMYNGSIDKVVLLYVYQFHVVVAIHLLFALHSRIFADNRLGHAPMLPGSWPWWTIRSWKTQSPWHGSAPYGQLVVCCMLLQSLHAEHDAAARFAMAGHVVP